MKNNKRIIKFLSFTFCELDFGVAEPGSLCGSISLRLVSPITAHHRPVAVRCWCSREFLNYSNLRMLERFPNFISFLGCPVHAP